LVKLYRRSTAAEAAAGWRYSDGGPAGPVRARSGGGVQAGL